MMATGCKSTTSENNKGTISESERATLDKYLRVGQFLDLMQAKARLSLNQ